MSRGRTSLGGDVKEVTRSNNGMDNLVEFKESVLALSDDDLIKTQEDVNQADLLSNNKLKNGTWEQNRTKLTPFTTSNMTKTQIEKQLMAYKNGIEGLKINNEASGIDMYLNQ